MLAMKNDIIFLLSDYLNNSQSFLTSSQEIVEIAQAHQVQPIVYYQTKELAAKLVYLQTISAYSQRKYLIEQITKAFSEIPFYIVKGISVARYYPVPQLRTMGDCDIIVHEKDKAKARKELLSIGFIETTGEWDDMEWHFQKQGLDFELHHRLLYDEAVNTETEKTFADTAWDYVTDHELDANFHFVYILLHLKKHLLNRGVGIRQFMDLAVMSKSADLDEEKVKTFLQQAGIEKFAGVCSAFCLRWFGISLPVETPEISDEFYDKATETILANGVFGFEASNQEENRLMNSIHKSGKIGSIIGHIFPSYKTCCITPKYKWIKGKPYLMPVLWVYRIFWALFSGKSKSSIDYVTSVASSDKAMTERNKELAAWGL